MTDWTAGYVADIGYTYGYYTELNPLRVKLAFINAGLVFPEVGAGCELGFGQGLTANLHAAASLTQWYGTDFNPSQAGFAQELAAVSGAQAHLYDEAFADFANRTDLPDFDYIGLHGIWSWISDENRTVVVDFIRRKLKVGGVLYISYNTQPGWAAMVPMRDLLTEHASTLGAEGQGIVSRIDSALAFSERLFAANPQYARANPQVAERLKKLMDQNRNYLAHEYFNRDWLPMSFTRMADWLASAKLDFACSAHYLDHVDGINLGAAQQTLLKEIPDPMFRQTVRDFCVNQQFRKDYWVKGGRRLNPLEQAERLRAQQVVLLTHRQDVPLKASGALGEADMSAAIYAPILDALADCQPHSIKQIEQSVKPQGVGLAQLLQALMVLAGAGHLATAQEATVAAEAKPAVEKLNAYLIDKARGSNDITYLASPVTGGGIMVSRFQQLFLLAMKQGKRQPGEWAEFVWQLLRGQGQRIIKEGQALEADDENLAELMVQSKEFAEKRLPILQALQIV